MKKESKNLEEDANDTYKNKFELIAVAAKRARKIREDKKRTLGGFPDKEPVIALEEILSGRLKVKIIRKNDVSPSEK